MGKLYFYYGTMNAGKTSMAINKAYEFSTHVKTYVYSPIKGQNKLESRNGSEATVNLSGDDWIDKIKDDSIVVIDEAQFLTKEEVIKLEDLCSLNDISVFCFGLRTDYTQKLFEGSKALFEYADSIREIPSMCNCCKSKAKYNFRITNEKNQIVFEKDKYVSLCKKHKMEYEKKK